MSIAEPEYRGAGSANPDHDLVRGEAQSRLSESDYVAKRCHKAGVPYPKEWMDYDDKVRAVLKDFSLSFPDRPARPDLSNREQTVIIKPLGFPDEAPDLEAENEALRARAEAAEARLAELESLDAPVGLPPNPSETKLADYYIPAEIRDLMEEGETFPQARKRLSELLNVEKAELRLKRAAGSATEAELKREADVDRLQGLFSKLGEI